MKLLEPLMEKPEAPLELLEPTMLPLELLEPLLEPIEALLEPPEALLEPIKAQQSLRQKRRGVVLMKLRTAGEPRTTMPLLVPTT